MSKVKATAGARNVRAAASQSRLVEFHDNCGGVVSLSHDGWRCGLCGAVCSIYVTTIKEPA